MEELLMWKGVPVLTTKMMAERLGVFETNIRANYLNNKTRFTENEDHFKLEGADLKRLKNELNQFDWCSDLVNPNAAYILLWTEGGAHNHAKIADTDEAWHAFLNLKQTYFRQRKALKAIKDAMNVDTPLFEHTKREVQVENSKQINTMLFENGGLESLKAYNIKSCKLHSGYYPNQLKKIAKDKGYKTKQMTSGKEVLRNLNPPVAACMSVSDAMCRFGANLDEVAPLSLGALPLFQKMKDLGMNINPPAKE